MGLRQVLAMQMAKEFEAGRIREAEAARLASSAGRGSVGGSRSAAGGRAGRVAGSTALRAQSVEALPVLAGAAPATEIGPVV